MAEYDNNSLYSISLTTSAAWFLLSVFISFSLYPALNNNYLDFFHLLGPSPVPAINKIKQ